MFLYGTYAVVSVVVRLLQDSRLEVWAEGATAAFGLLLILSAAFVRVRVPGGLALAIGAMLGLQALAVHAAAHLRTGLPSQVVRGAIAAFLVLLAHFASQEHRR